MSIIYCPREKGSPGRCEDPELSAVPGKCAIRDQGKDANYCFLHSMQMTVVVTNNDILWRRLNIVQGIECALRLGGICYAILVSRKLERFAPITYIKTSTFASLKHVKYFTFLIKHSFFTQLYSLAFYFLFVST